MENITLSEKILPLANWADNKADEKSIIQSKLVSRISFVFLAILTVITHTADYVGFIASSIPVILSGGALVPRDIMKSYGLSSLYIITNLFHCVLKTVNPHAVLYTDQIQNRSLLTNYIITPLLGVADGCKESNYWLVRQVGTRALIVVELIAGVITNLVDGLIGLVAAVFALLLLGTNQRLNEFAAQELIGIGNLFAYPFSSIVEFIHPSAVEP